MNDKINFSGYASAFNTIDKHNDVIGRGAFEKTIKNFGSQYINLLFQHDLRQKVGQITKIEEDEYGLFIEGFIDTKLPNSKQLISDINTGKVLHFSIGFYPINVTKKGSINYINNLDLIEISFVSKPANPKAIIINAEGIYADSNIYNLIKELGSFIKSPKRLYST